MYRGVFLTALAGAGVVLAVLVGTASGGGSFALTSTAFSEGGSIPSAYTCDGPNNRPPLAWTNAPGDTASFAILVDDVTSIAVVGGPIHFTHWITWNIEGQAASPDAGKSHRIFGTNDFGRVDYGGPCAPTVGVFSGLHTYVFTLYALKTPLTLAVGATRSQFDAAIAANVVKRGTATLTGTYCRGCP